VEIKEQAGDWVDIDDLVEKYRAMGYTADYENLRTWNWGFWAELTISNANETTIMLISGSSEGHFVESVKQR
jgi:hypothetical protein